MHLIALLEVLCGWLVAGKHLPILLQIPTHVFIHDRKQKEELLIDAFLLNSTQTVTVRMSRGCRLQLTACVCEWITKQHLGSVLPQRSLLAHEQRSHQSSVGVYGRIGGRVVQVGDTGGISRGRTF